MAELKTSKIKEVKVESQEKKHSWRDESFIPKAKREDGGFSCKQVYKCKKCGETIKLYLNEDPPIFGCNSD